MSQKLIGSNAAVKTNTEGVAASMNKLTETAAKTGSVVNNNATQIASSAIQINKLNAAYDRMSRLGVQRFGRVKKSASETNAEVARQLPILDRLRNKLSSYERKALGVGNNIKKGFGSVVNYLGPVGATIGGVFAFSQMKQGFHQVTNAASDLNESTNKSKEIFGGSFKAIKSFSDGAAKSIGMSKAQALGAASSFGQLFGNLGFGEAKTAKFSESTVRLAADLASFNNMNMDDSLQALMATLKGETEPAMRFGVLLNDMTVKQKAFQLGLIKTTKEAMTPAIKTQAIYGLVLEQTKKAQGDFGRTSEDVANKTRILQAAQVDLQAKIGSGLLPIKLKLINVMISAVDWISKNSERLLTYGRTALWVGGALLGLYGAARTILFAKHYYLTVAKAMMVLRKSTFLTAIAQKALALGQTLAMLATNGMARALVLAKLKMIAFNIVANLNPFVWIGTAIVGVIMLIKHWDKVKVWLSKFWDWFKNIMSKVAAWAINNHPLMWMVNIIDKVFPGFKQKLNEVFEWIKEAFSKLGQWIFDKVIGPIGRFFKAAATEYSKDFQPKVKQPQFAKPFQFDAVARVQTDKNFAGVTSFLKPKTTSDQAAAPTGKEYYGGLLGDLSSGGSKGSDTGTKDKTSTVGDSVSGLVQAGGKEVKNITIRIENLVKQMDFNVTKTIRETSGQMKEEVVKALLTAVNDVNYQ
jgi:hypothetical protein